MSSSKTKDKVEGGFLLNVVIWQGASIFQLFPCKNQALLVWRDSFFILDLGLDIINGIAGLNI